MGSPWVTAMIREYGSGRRAEVANPAHLSLNFFKINGDDVAFTGGLTDIPGSTLGAAANWSNP